MGALIVAATALLARWLVGYSLAPVARMTERAASWDEQDPSRRFYLEEPRDELGRLAAVFDQLLRRLALSLRRERELTAEVSHELRTPLAKILGEAELAAAPHREPEDRRSAITRIQRHATELQRVLEALLASARAGTSSAGESCSACQAARQAAAAAGPAITAAGKTLDVRCHGSFRVAAGPELLERALAPLLENAARYAKRQIVLEVLPSADKAVFEVADDGEGIPAGDRARIFDAGFRGRDTADGHSGSGLGLALVRRLSSAAGGEVEAIESAEGTRLILRMPLA
jgi:signal transduction histidine kinase